MKKIIRNVLMGIALGCTVFVIISIIFALINGDSSMYTTDEFIKNAICSMIVGVGFSLPAIVYDNDKMSMGIKVLIHMGIGISVYLIIAFIAGWIPVKEGLGAILTTILIAIIISFIIWFFFYLYNKNEVKKLNTKIRETQIKS